MPRSRGSIRADLRAASRAPVAKRPLGELLEAAAAAPSDVRLWLAERWPWTPGTEGALHGKRPRWAVAVVELERVRQLPVGNAEASVRELNRAHDPWPEDSKRLVAPRSRDEAPAPVDAPDADPDEEP